MEIVEGKFKSFQINFIDGDRSHRYPKVEEFIEQGVAFLNGESINTGIVDLSKANFISEEKYDSIKKGRVSLGDIVMTTRGNGVGQVAYISQDIKGLINAQMLIIRSDNETINSLFLFYYMSSKAIQQQIRNFSSGSAQPQIPIKDLKSLYLSIPKAISTQQKIASILSAYDELIENNKQRIKLLEEMAEEIYKEWFVRLRFPNYENTEFVDGLPKGWRIVRLKECFEHYIGGGWGEDTPSVKNNEPAYVIRGTDIPNAKVGNLNFEVLRYHSASNLLSRRLQANDIVFEVSGGTETQSLGRSLLISKSLIDRFDEDLICASFCKLIRAKQSLISGLFIYLLLNRLYKTGEIMLYQVQSTGISNYKFEDFIEKQKVQIPTTEIQDSFNEIIQPMFDEIQMLGAKNQLLQQTRDLLLPRLISGKLSVEGLAEVKEYVLGQNGEHWPMAAEAEGEYHH